MGITARYRRVTSQEFVEFQNDLQPNEWLFKTMLQDKERYFDLAKEWQALHFLLTGDACSNGEVSVPEPLGNAIMGGTLTEVETSYGFVRYLTPGEVREVAEALGKVSTEELRSRFTPAAFNEAKIYPSPSPGGWDEEEIEGLLEFLYPLLVKFFQNAARDGNTVLLWLS